MLPEAMDERDLVEVGCCRACLSAGRCAAELWRALEVVTASRVQLAPALVGVLASGCRSIMGKVSIACILGSAEHEA